MSENQKLIRKLTPAYNAIEVGDFKACIRHCEGKDVRAQPLVVALKMYAMERKSYHEILTAIRHFKGTDGPKPLSAGRQGNGKDGIDIENYQTRLNEVLHIALDIAGGTGEISRQTVNHLFLVLRNSGAWSAVAEMYNELIRRYSDNVEFFQHLFISQLRIGKWDCSVKLGMQMARQLKDDIYLGWCATILVYDAKRSVNLGLIDNGENDDFTEARRKLSLASMLLRKLAKSYPIKENKFVDQERGKKSAEQSNRFQESVRHILLKALVYEKNYDEAISLIDNEPHFETEYERKAIKAEILQLNSDFEWSAKIYSELLMSDKADNWRTWCGLLESWFNSSDFIVGKVDRYLSEIRLQIDKYPDVRGPCLALVYFNLERMICSKSNNISEKVDTEFEYVQSLCAYLEKFDSNPCCFGDLRNALLSLVSAQPDDINSQKFLSFLKTKSRKKEKISRALCPKVHFPYPKLESTTYDEQCEKKRSRRWPIEEYAGLVETSSEARTHFIEFLKERLKGKLEILLMPSELIDRGDARRALRTVTTVHQCMRFLGCWEALCKDESIDVAKSIIEAWEKSFWIDGKADTAGSGDDLALLASHLLVDCCDNKQEEFELSQADCSFITMAIALLEKAYENSSGGFQLGLMLIELYSRLDMMKEVFKVYSGLEIRYIQIDTLSHFVLGDALGCGKWVEGVNYCNDIDIFSSSKIENTEFLQKALRLGNLYQGYEFLRLDEILSHSHQRALAITERSCIQSLSHHFSSWEKFQKRIVLELQPHSKSEYRLFTRVGDLALQSSAFKHGSLLCTSDFGVRSGWDYPLGRSARRYSSLTGNAFFNSTFSQPRACQGSSWYDKLWYQKSLEWMKFRLSVCQLFHIAATGGFSVIGSASHELFIERLGAELDSIGAYSEGKNCSQSIHLWHCAYTAAKATVSLVGCDHLTTDERVPSISDEINDLGKRLEDAISMFTEVSCNKGCIRDFASLLQHQLQWLTILVRGWMDLSPRKKKKKNSDKNENTQIANLQNSIKACSGSLLALLDKIISHFEPIGSIDLSEAIVEKFSFVNSAHLESIQKAYLESQNASIEHLRNLSISLQDVIRTRKY